MVSYLVGHSISKLVIQLLLFENVRVLAVLLSVLIKNWVFFFFVLHISRIVRLFYVFSIYRNDSRPENRSW